MALNQSTKAGGGSFGRSTAPGSIVGQWQAVQTEADSETTEAAATTHAQTEDDGHQWTRVSQPATRISALRHAYSGGTLTGGATVSIITADREWEGINAGEPPTADVRTQTIDAGIALATTTDQVTVDSVTQCVTEDNAGEGWDLLGAAAFLIVVTTAAAGTATIKLIEAKVLN